ncbi:hypothetical protein CYMTET_40322 [Cymbomonas tetramitiformis]|uniref:Uncharacterized protein n=1 Tax=Cymbomonas tetramitiformis TaxID=36881 RepID=A0AAE0CAG5_9CHLO|nr:hypothetical protein CYMTET_40322 [Cymbomonas tetramitiformis]
MLQGSSPVSNNALQFNVLDEMLHSSPAPQNAVAQDINHLYVRIEAVEKRLSDAELYFYDKSNFEGPCKELYTKELAWPQSDNTKYYIPVFPYDLYKKVISMYETNKREDKPLPVGRVSKMWQHICREQLVKVVLNDGCTDSDCFFERFGWFVNNYESIAVDFNKKEYTEQELEEIINFLKTGPFRKA